MTTNSSMRFYTTLAVLAFVEFFASGFVLIFQPEAGLPATLVAPNVNFVWDGKAPPFSDKETFRGGTFADQSDHDAMLKLLNEAMATWSNVPGSFIKLSVTEDAGVASANRTDHIYSIVLAPTHSASSAAYASPVAETLTPGHRVISDCDITVNTTKVTLAFMVYALTHETGHCLGFGHAHDNYRSIMGYSRTPGDAKLGADDKAGLIYLYDDPAYGDGKVREAVAAKCGVLGEGVVGSHVWVLLVLGLPLLAILRRRRACPELFRET